MLTIDPARLPETMTVGVAETFRLRWRWTLKAPLPPIVGAESCIRVEIYVIASTPMRPPVLCEMADHLDLKADWSEQAIEVLHSTWSYAVRRFLERHVKENSNAGVPTV